MTLALAILGALIGASLGSFISATAWRLPRGVSLRRRSRCPQCEAAIPLWRNLPVLTWLLQRGRGACCGAKITPRVLLAEFGGALFGAALGYMGGPWALAGASVFCLLGAGAAWLFYRERAGATP